MKTYEKYKDSGVEWIGEIPEHWECKMIKRLSPIKRGASPRPIDNPIYFDNNGEYSWVRIADVSASERYLEYTEQTLSELGASLSVKRNPGDFFLSIAGTVGKPIITKIKCCIHDGFVYFPNLKINPEYLYYIFTTGMPYKGLGKWGTQLNLNTDTVGDIYIPVPLDNEIESQINFLDRKTAEIDRIIANKQKLIALYEEEKQAIINQAVSKGLDPNVKLKDSGVEWLGEIPEHWAVKKIGYCATIVRGGSPRPSGDPRYFCGDFMPWITVKEVTNAVGKFIESTDEYLTEEGSKLSRIIYPESLLLSNSGATLGVPKISKIKGCINDGSVAFTSFYDCLLRDYLYHFFVSHTSVYREEMKGNGQPNLNTEIIKATSIAVPPLNEQLQIIAYIEKECTRLDAIIEKFNKQIDLLQEYRTTLISEVVTGKVRVTE
ncbi:MAG TPA: restriction endonuclease subunit S [Paludibacteraceae bacterium]|nr:restriction endonuclease subunit S [Paludibacteraceae bacterium]